MVLVIRTQDYASRNLNRLSQNLGKLSKTQQLQRRLQMESIRADRLAQRKDTLARDVGLLRRRLDLEQQLNSTIRDRRMVERGISRTQAATAATGRIQGAGGRFIGPSAPIIAQAQAGLQQLIGKEAQLRVEQRRLTKEIGLTNSALAGMSTAKASAELHRLQRELGLTSRQLRVAQADVAVTKNAINQLRWDNIHRGGQTLSRFGRVMQLTGLIATGSFVAMGNTAANFSASASLAATQARNLGNNIGGQEEVLAKSARLQAAIIEQMQKYPNSAEEMTNATYEIFSSLDLMNERGIVDVTKGLRILDLANKAAVAGGVSLDDSMRGLIITLNNFDANLDNLTPTLDTMFDIVRFGNIHFSDLTNIMTKVAPAAKAVGLSLEDVAGVLAQATRTLTAGTVSAGFSQLLSTFSDRNFQEGIRVISKARLGRVIDISEAGKLKAPLEILRDLLTVFPELGKGGLETRRFFKLVTRAGQFSLTGRETAGREFTIQQRRVFEAIVQNFGQVEELQAAILANNGELEKSFQVMLQDPGVQWKIFLSQMRALVLTIGNLALPAILSLVSGIQRMVQWFRSLSPATQDMIVKIGVFGSAAALLFGIVSSLVGGLVSLAGSLGLLNAGKLINVARAVAFLKGAGVIGILLLAKWGGDPSAIDFIIGAISGALAGSRLGPAGIVTGAITVPIIMKVISEDKSPLQMAMDEGRRMAMEQEGLFKNIVSGFTLPSFTGIKVFEGKFNEESFIEQWQFLINKTVGKPLPAIKPTIDPGVLQLFNKYKSMIPAIKNDTDDWADSIERALTKAGDKEALTQFNKFLKTVPELENMFGAAGDSAKGMSDAVQAAAEQAEQAIDQAAQRMTQIWEQFRSENAAAFGELFSGPFFQSETWTLAEEWDVKPTMREINRDLKEQIAAFRKWRSTLASISKRKGATPELMKELQALGPGAMKFLEVLQRGAPGAFNNFIKLWKTKQSEINKATQIDFDKQLAQWFKYGKGIAQQIILGLRSENVALDNAFKKYITDKFPGIVADAKKAAIAEFNRNNPPTKTTGGAQGGGGGGGKTNSDNTTVTVIVHPREGETTMHALKRGAWEYANGPKKGRDGKGLPPKGSKIIVDPPESNTGGGPGKRRT